MAVVIFPLICAVASDCALAVVTSKVVQKINIKIAKLFGAIKHSFLILWSQDCLKCDLLKMTKVMSVE